jgi:organic radical activating enzyme
MKNRIKHAIELDWSGEMVPHGVLDLLRGCNASCDCCYNAAEEFRPRPLNDIRNDLETLLKLRRLQAISLTGGEPLLHPEIYTIIRETSAAGLRTVLMTNGILLDEYNARRLKEAGLDMLLLHIQSRQKRPDLPIECMESLRELRRYKAECAQSAGLDVGFSALMYPDAASHDEIKNLLLEIKNASNTHFLMVCPQGDFSQFSHLRGNMGNGFASAMPDGAAPLLHDQLISREAEALYRLLSDAGFGLFAWIGSSCDPSEMRWSSWGAGVLHNTFGRTALPIRPAWTDRLLIKMNQLATGRNLFHVRPSTARFRFQLILSLFSLTAQKTAIQLLAGSMKADANLYRKHVMVELPPVMKMDGRVAICRECPDAAVRNGKLVPPCLIDRLEHPEHQYKQT